MFPVPGARLDGYAPGQNSGEIRHNKDICSVHGFGEAVAAWTAKTMASNISLLLSGATESSIDAAPPRP